VTCLPERVHALVSTVVQMQRETTDAMWEITDAAWESEQALWELEGRNGSWLLAVG